MSRSDRLRPGRRLSFTTATWLWAAAGSSRTRHQAHEKTNSGLRKTSDWSHMKIAVFGATGATGQQVVQQALEQGHSVTALARTPERLAITHSSLRIVKGNVLDPAAVEQTIQGTGAVLSCLGRRP